MTTTVPFSGIRASTCNHIYTIEIPQGTSIEKTHELMEKERKRPCKECKNA